MSHVRRHMSDVTCLVSGVTCQVLFFLYKVVGPDMQNVIFFTPSKF